MNKEIKFMLISAEDDKAIVLATFPDIALSLIIEKFGNVWKPVFFNSANSPEIYWRNADEEKNEREKVEAWLASSKKLLFTEREIQELLENKELSFPVLEDSCN